MTCPPSRASRSCRALPLPLPWSVLVGGSEGESGGQLAAPARNCVSARPSISSEGAAVGPSRRGQATQKPWEPRQPRAATQHCAREGAPRQGREVACAGPASWASLLKRPAGAGFSFRRRPLRFAARKVRNAAPPQPDVGAKSGRQEPSLGKLTREPGNRPRAHRQRAPLRAQRLPIRTRFVVVVPPALQLCHYSSPLGQEIRRPTAGARPQGSTRHRGDRP